MKRRLEVKSNQHQVTVYDDFAHHPTAIGKTLNALKASSRHRRIFVVLEFASYTMRTGVHALEMAEALKAADFVLVQNPTDFNLDESSKHWQFPYQILPNVNAIVEAVVPNLAAGDAVLVMSNRGFDGIHQRLVEAIDRRFAETVV